MYNYFYKTFVYYAAGKGTRSWDIFLNKMGKEGWGLVYTQEISGGKRNCTFVKVTAP